MPIADNITHNITIPEGVKVVFENKEITVSGPNATLTKSLNHRNISVQIKTNLVSISVDLPRRTDKALLGTWRAHITNMIHGAKEDFVYRLKAVYSHFPMTVDANGPNNTFVVKNYYGEKVPRTTPILPGTKIKVENKVDIIVSGADKVTTGQMAANVERLCTVGRRDRRVFQDGIYITEKGVAQVD